MGRGERVLYVAGRSREGGGASGRKLGVREVLQRIEPCDIMHGSLCCIMCIAGAEEAVRSLAIVYMRVGYIPFTFATKISGVGGGLYLDNIVPPNGTGDKNGEHRSA